MRGAIPNRVTVVDRCHYTVGLVIPPVLWCQTLNEAALA